MAELLAHKHFLCTCERCTAEEKGEYSAAPADRAEMEQPAIHECAPTDDESAAVLAAALLAAGPAAVLSPPTSTPSAVADEGINAARLDTWLKLGGVHCPKCLGHKDASDDEKEEHKVNDDGKKKNKLKIKNPSQLCPLRAATRAGQKARAIRMMNPMNPIPYQAMATSSAGLGPIIQVSTHTTFSPAHAEMLPRSG